MLVKWDRSLSTWSSGFKPEHFSVKRPFLTNDFFHIRNIKDPWIKRTINGVSYYGKNLEEEDWEKIKIVMGKIIPIAILFLLVLPAPALLYMQAHEKLKLWVFQIHYNSKLKYKITQQQNISLPITIPSVTKYATQDKEDLRLDLIHEGKLKIHDIPELSGGKEKILNYILIHGNKLTYLELPEKHWEDKDLEDIVNACPNLKTFIYHGSQEAVTFKGLKKLLELVQLEELFLKSCSPTHTKHIMDEIKHQAGFEAWKKYEAKVWSKEMTEAKRSKLVAKVMARWDFESFEKIS